MEKLGFSRPEAPCTRFQQRVLGLQVGLVFEQLSDIEADAVLGLAPADIAAGKLCPTGIAHGLLQHLLELGLTLFLVGNRLANGLQFNEGCGQPGMATKVDDLTVVIRIEAAQGRFSGSRAISRWRCVGFNVVPELALQLDQASDHLLIPFDAVDLQCLTTQQYRYIRRLLAGDGELVHHLQLHILRHALFPEACPVYAGCLAFEDLHVVSPDHLAVDVGQHPRLLRIRVLQYSIDAPYFVLSALAVVPGHDGLQDVTPVHRAFLIVRISLGHAGIPSGFLQPQLQLRFIGIQSYCCGSIRAANALLADLQPVLAGQFLGADQT